MTGRTHYTFLIVLMALLFLPQVGSSAHKIGGKSTEDYDINPNTGLPWLDQLWMCDDIVGGFVNTMNGYSDATRSFWTDSVSAAYFNEGSSYETSSQGVDSVDVFAVCTHGGLDIGTGGGGHTSNFSEALRGNQQRAYSDNFRFGDDGEKMKIFASFSCSSMADGYTDRWDNVFKGGLKYAYGYWGSPTWSDAVKPLGTNLANTLHASGKTLKYAWLDVADDYSDQNPAVMASGNQSGDDCSYRRDNMKWSNFTSSSYDTLRDGNVTVLCRTRRQS